MWRYINNPKIIKSNNINLVEFDYSKGKPA